MFKRIGIVALMLLLAVAGCGGTAALRQHGPDSGAKTELLVSAAASLTDALQNIRKQYEAGRSVKLTFNFAASGTLQQQIEQGAPADLLISASAKNMKALVDRQLVEPSEQANLLTNELVVITPAGGKVAVRKLGDLTDAAVKQIAIGIPESVPAGGYAKDALVKAKLWDPLQGKLVQARDVRQVLNYVETGNTDAGFVYKTDALSSGKVKVAFSLDPASYPPVEYPAGIVKTSKHPKEAREFFDYLQSKEALDVFVRYGFSLPK